MPVDALTSTAGNLLTALRLDHPEQLLRLCGVVAGPVGTRTIPNILGVRFTNLRTLIIIYKGQKRVSAAFSHRRDLVHERSGEHDRRTGRHFKPFRTIFGEVELTAFEVIV